VYGEECIELLVNRMIHELTCDTEGPKFIVDNRYIDDDRLINCLTTKLFDSKDTDITKEKIYELFSQCMLSVWRYSKQHTENTDEMSWRCYKLLLRLIPKVDCNRQIGSWSYSILLCVDTGSVSLTKLIVQQNINVNVSDDFNSHVLHKAVGCGENNVSLTDYLLSLPDLDCLNHTDKYNHTPYWCVVHNNNVLNKLEMIEMYEKHGAIM